MASRARGSSIPTRVRSTSAAGASSPARTDCFSRRRATNDPAPARRRLGSFESAGRNMDCSALARSPVRKERLAPRLARSSRACVRSGAITKRAPMSGIDAAVCHRVRLRAGEYSDGLTTQVELIVAVPDHYAGITDADQLFECVRGRLIELRNLRSVGSSDAHVRHRCPVQLYGMCPVELRERDYTALVD